MSIIKIAVVDDQRIFCEGIESLLNKEHGLKVIMLAYSGRDILKQLEKSDDLPDIILLDLDMPNLGGKETLPYLKNKYPQIKVVILSLHSDLCIVKEMISLGASGYLCKGLEEVLKRDFPDAIKTDITPVINEVNAGYPRIKYDF